MFWTETGLPAKCVGQLQASHIHMTRQEKLVCTLGMSLIRAWVVLTTLPISVLYAPSAMRVLLTRRLRARIYKNCLFRFVVQHLKTNSNYYSG